MESLKKANSVEYIYLNWTFVFGCLLALSDLRCFAADDQVSNCFPSLFSFGDSKADNGNEQSAYPYESRAEAYPYGMTHPGYPTDRYCDGYLVIDYQAIGYGFNPLPSTYLRGFGAHFKHGVNFAQSASGCIPNYANSSFYLSRQINQFKKLKAEYTHNHTAAERDNLGLFPPEKYFEQALYVISHGENDYRAAILEKGVSPSEIETQLVPLVIAAISSAIKGLYSEGAMNFFVVGIAADGCIPMMLTLVPGDHDERGCLIPVNDYVKFHNKKLLEEVKGLRKNLTKAHIAYGDYYGINVELIDSHSKYGFENTHNACCGYGGKYNYNNKSQCGQNIGMDGSILSIVEPCKHPPKYISWDGIHLTDHFYQEVARAFLNGTFVDNPFPPCLVDFTNFTIVDVGSPP